MTLSKAVYAAHVPVFELQSKCTPNMVTLFFSQLYSHSTHTHTENIVNQQHSNAHDIYTVYSRMVLGI